MDPRQTVLLEGEGWASPRRSAVEGDGADHALLRTEPGPRPGYKTPGHHQKHCPHAPTLQTATTVQKTLQHLHRHPRPTKCAGEGLLIRSVIVPRQRDGGEDLK